MLYTDDKNSLIIEVCKTTDDSEWDNFVDQSVNGTIFHKMSFLSYHKLNKYNWYHLKFRNKKTSELMAVLPAAITAEKNLNSPSGASYGAFVFKKTDLLMTELTISAFVDFCRINKINEVNITPAPLIYSNELNQNLDFLLQYYGLAVQKHLISNAVWVDQIKDRDFRNIASNMHLRCVRKAKREKVSVSVEDSIESYAEFYEMLLENKRKFNTLPAHTLDELFYLQKGFPESIKLFMARDGHGKGIGAIWSIETNQNTLLAFYIAHYYNYRELRAVNLLYQSIVEYALENKTAWVDLGVSMDTTSANPMEPSRSLIYFKECIGTRGFLRTTYRGVFK